MTTSPRLSRHLGDVRRFPVLSAGEELELARRWRDRGDSEAVHKLVTSHLRLVAKIAMRYRGYGFPVSELMSEGHVGMMKALTRFDPDRGFRLATYATLWIRASVQEYVLRSWSLVKMGTTSRQKRLFFNLRRLKNDMLLVEGNALTIGQVSEIAAKLAVPKRDVISMNQRLASRDFSLDAPVSSGRKWEDSLEDDNASQEVDVAEKEELAGRRALLPGALESLNNRERHIINERWLTDEPSTLEELSRHYKISRERIRQIEGRALIKLQREMMDSIAQRAITRQASIESRCCGTHT